MQISGKKGEILNKPLMSKPHILFHRPTPWQSELQCSTKTYAQLFSEAGYPVTYLQANSNLAHLALRKGYYHNYKLGSRFEGNIWVTGALSAIPHIDNKGKTLAQLTAANSYLTAMPSIKKLVSAGGHGAPQIIWTTIPGSSALKRIYPKAKLFFHVVDMYSAYRGSGIEYLEKTDYQKADHLFVIGQALQNYLQEKFQVPAEKITNLGQGVHLDQYEGTVAKPTALENIKGPVAMWIGLTRKLDQSMLSALSQAMQERGGSVVLIGPPCDWLPEFVEKHSNTHFLGPIKAAEVPAYLRHAQLGIMTYDRSRQEIYKGQHPLKLYEYAAAGLPVLCTPHEEFDTLQPPILEVRNEAETKEGVKSVFENYEAHKSAMLAFAQKHSWQSCKLRAEEAFQKLDAL